MIWASGDAAVKYLVLSVVIKNTSFAAVTNCTSPDLGAGGGGTVAVHLRNRASQRTYEGGALARCLRCCYCSNQQSLRGHREGFGYRGESRDLPVMKNNLQMKISVLILMEPQRVSSFPFAPIHNLLPSLSSPNHLLAAKKCKSALSVPHCATNLHLFSLYTRCVSFVKLLP